VETVLTNGKAGFKYSDVIPTSMEAPDRRVGATGPESSTELKHLMEIAITARWHADEALLNPEDPYLNLGGPSGEAAQDGYAKGLEQAVRQIAGYPFGLSSALWTRESPRAGVA
jgi:hypothetical protein